MIPVPEISAMFQRCVTTRTRALCRQRHTIAAAITGALPSSQSSATNRHNVTNSIVALNYSCHGYYSSVIKSTPLVPIGKANTSASILAKHGVHIRTFKSVGDYHNVADETVDSIQDAVDDFLEDHYDADAAEKGEDVPEVNYSSGVMTLSLPPHGTWIINKQTPNQQLWWSSPISGPKRYEYDEKRKNWVCSRVLDGGGTGDAGEVSYGEEDTLGGILNKEFKELFGEGLDLDEA